MLGARTAPRRPAADRSGGVLTSWPTKMQINALNDVPRAAQNNGGVAPLLVFPRFARIELSGELIGFPR
jgi:hypothetical protein